MKTPLGLRDKLGVAIADVFFAHIWFTTAKIERMHAQHRHWAPPLAFRTLWHGIRQPECVHDFDGSCSIALDWVSLDWVGLLWLAFDWIASDWLALGSIGLDCNWVLLGGWMAGRLASRVCSGVLGSGCLGGRVSEWLGA